MNLCRVTSRTAVQMVQTILCHTIRTVGPVRLSEVLVLQRNFHVLSVCPPVNESDSESESGKGEPNRLTLNYTESESESESENMKIHKNCLTAPM